MVWSTALTASVAVLLSPIRPETASIRSRLFMFLLPRSPPGPPLEHREERGKPALSARLVRAGSLSRIADRDELPVQPGRQRPRQVERGHLPARLGQFGRQVPAIRRRREVRHPRPLSPRGKFEGTIPAAYKAYRGVG